MTTFRWLSLAFVAAVLAVSACGTQPMKSDCTKDGCKGGTKCNPNTGVCLPSAGGGAGGGNGGGSSNAGGGTGGSSAAGGGLGGGSAGGGSGGGSAAGGGSGGGGDVDGGVGGGGVGGGGVGGGGVGGGGVGGGGVGGGGVGGGGVGGGGVGGGVGGGGVGGGGVGGGGVGGGGGGGGGVGGGGVGGGGVGGGGVGGGGVGGGGGATNDGGFPFCVARDAGIAPCTTECPQGFKCVNGGCVLNGGQGQVQVTLRWNTQEDLDLHLDEPGDAGVCEIFYGDTNDPDSGTGSSCGAIGTLDLDSEAGCPIPPDNVDIENIVYAQGATAPSGTYTVRVDHYENCNMSVAYVPYQVEVRVNGVVSGVCGVFLPTDSDWENFGGAGDGRQVMTFVVP